MSDTWKDRQRAEALRLFRIVQGPGDAGSEAEFNCRRETEQAGWMRVAAVVIEGLDAIEDLARQHCFTDRKPREYRGVPEINTTDSGGLSADAETLRLLAQHGRFRIEREHGRMVVGYWPENDPQKKP